MLPVENNFRSDVDRLEALSKDWSVVKNLKKYEVLYADISGNLKSYQGNGIAHNTVNYIYSTVYGAESIKEVWGPEIDSIMLLGKKLADTKFVICSIQDDLSSTDIMITDVYKALSLLRSLKDEMENDSDGLKNFAETYEGKTFQNRDVKDLIDDIQKLRQKELVDSIKALEKLVQNSGENLELKLIEETFLRKDLGEGKEFQEMQLDEAAFKERVIDTESQSKIQKGIDTTRRLPPRRRDIDLDRTELDINKQVKNLFVGKKNNIALEKIGNDHELMLPEQFLKDFFRTKLIAVNGEKIVANDDEVLRKSENPEQTKIEVLERFFTVCSQNIPEEQKVVFVQRIARFVTQAVGIDLIGRVGFLSMDEDQKMKLRTGVGRYWNIKLEDDVVILECKQGVEYLYAQNKDGSFPDFAPPFLLAKRTITIPLKELLDENADTREDPLPGLTVEDTFSKNFLTVKAINLFQDRF